MSKICKRAGCGREIPKTRPNWQTYCSRFCWEKRNNPTPPSQPPVRGDAMVATTWTHDLPAEIGVLMDRLATCDGRQADAAVVVWEQCQLIVTEFRRLCALVAKLQEASDG
jgi:hypothetical protein